MKTSLFIIPLLALSLGSCSKINETMDSLEQNQMAVDESTQMILENTRAIEEANKKIDENRRQLEKINESLKKAEES